MADNSIINGIDYLEVSDIDQKILEVHFIHPLPGETGGLPIGPPLQEKNIVIEGGVRVKDIRVDSVISNGEVLTVIVNGAGDFSNYTLRLVVSPTDITPPANFDPQLSELEFSFKANCPSDFDCKTEIICPEEKTADPRIDYLAKDYASFRRLMLDRLSLLMPQWRERNAADLQIALVELLAYTGDYLSYYQDAVATEAYLFKTRQRISARRHARLLDYHAHNGCNARAWVFVEVESGGNADTAILNQNTKMLTKGDSYELTFNLPDLSKRLMGNQVEVFETKHDLKLYAVHNAISFYTWDDQDCCLPIGVTKATLFRKDQQDIFLEPEQVLIFEEILSPTTGSHADIDTSHRHAVRLTKVKSDTDILSGLKIVEIEWHKEDALPFAVCISKRIEGVFIEDISIARGNIVLVDHGRTKEPSILSSSAPAKGLYRPLLPDIDITVSTKYVHDKLKTKPAASASLQDPKQAIPVVTLMSGEDSWHAQRDLLASTRFAQEFVAEIESDLTVRLRFGDDNLGEKPGEGFQPKATYRIGNGLSGNVGPEAIGSIEWDKGGITNVRNPMPAQGGVNPETAEEVKQFAPEAFRTQERAVTEADYVAKTELHPEVQKALATFRWTGSWHTVFLTIDRKDGLLIDDDFKIAIFQHLEKYRMAGYDLEVRPPVFVPLEIEMRVCVKPGYFKSNVKANLQAAFSRFDLPDGSRGFFHPDMFTFGQAVYVSALYERAMGISGVLSVELKTFKRLNRAAQLETVNGLLKPANSEIIRLDNDPNFPENGKINFLMSGGL